MDIFINEDVEGGGDLDLMLNDSFIDEDSCSCEAWGICLVRMEIWKLKTMTIDKVRFVEKRYVSVIFLDEV